MSESYFKTPAADAAGVVWMHIKMCHASAFLKYCGSNTVNVNLDADIMDQIWFCESGTILDYVHEELK